MNSTNWIRFPNFFPKNKRASSAPFSRGAAKESVALGDSAPPLSRGAGGDSSPRLVGGAGADSSPLIKGGLADSAPPSSRALGGILFPLIKRIGAGRHRCQALCSPLIKGGWGGFPLVCQDVAAHRLAGPFTFCQQDASFPQHNQVDLLVRIPPAANIQERPFLLGDSIS